MLKCTQDGPPWSSGPAPVLTMILMSRGEGHGSKSLIFGLCYLDPWSTSHGINRKWGIQMCSGIIKWDWRKETGDVNK